MSESVLSAAFLLLLIFDPFGNIPLVASLLKSVAPERRWRLILRECAIAFCVLLVFMVFGAKLMSALHLTETSLGISGGVVLFLIALRMIFPPATGGIFGESEGNGEPFIVPIAIPAIAGPSAMAMVMLLVSREPHRLLEWVGALGLATIASVLVLLLGARLMSFLGARGMAAIERLMGLILCAVAVEMLLNGIQAFVRTL